MSWFKKKDSPVIPPVNEQARSDYLGTGTPNSGRSVSPGAVSSSRVSSSSTYVASRDGDPYAKSNDPYARPTPARYNSGGGGGEPGGIQPPPGRDRYNRNNPISDSYSRGDANLEQDRAELFAGYDSEKHKPTGRFSDGPSRSDYGGAAAEDEEDEAEGIKKQSRFVKQESVNSTRNALRLAREAEETARKTLDALGRQSETLANTSRHLDTSKGHADRVKDKQGELKQLNQSIFRPVITFNKEGKRAAQEAKLLRRHELEREEREKAMMDIRDSQNRIGRAQTYGYGADDGDEEEEAVGGYGRSRFTTPEDQATKKAARAKYQFEATASDDEMEDELDDNLNEISDMTKRLKALGTAMGQELDDQNIRIGKLDEKTVKLDNELHQSTRRFDKIK